MAKTHDFYAEGREALDRCEINVRTDTIKVAYMKPSYGFSKTAHKYWSDIKLDECVITGYTSGGYTLSGVTVDNSTNPLVVKIAANNVLHSVLNTDSNNAVRRLVVWKSTGNDATSPLISCADLDENMTVMVGVLWNAEGMYSGIEELSTAALPETILSANIVVTNVNTSGYTVQVVGASSLANTDYLQFAEDGHTSSSNIVSDANGNKIFTPAQAASGVQLVSSNAANTQQTVEASGVNNNIGRGAWTPKQFIVPVNQPPSIPTNLQESNKTTTSVTISFTGSSDPDTGDFVEAYRLYLKTNTTPPVIGVDTPFLANTGGTLGNPPATAFNAGGLTPGSTVYGWVTSRDNNGNESAVSARIDIVIPSNMPPSVGAANILVSNATATTPGTIDAFTVKIGTISNADTIKTVRVAFFTAAELANKDTNWGTIPSGRKIELVAGVDDAAIIAIQGGNGQAFTGKALTKDTTYTPSVIVEETKGEGGTQWGSWVEATATVLYASPTCTVQAPTNVVAETTAANNNGSLTANGTTSVGLQRNVTTLDVSVGPSSVGDGDPENAACAIKLYTGLNIASNTAFTQAVTALDLPTGAKKKWLRVGDNLAGKGAWTPTPNAFTVYPILTSIDVTSPSATGYTIECDSNIEAAEYSAINIFISTTNYALGSVPGDTNDAAITTAMNAAGESYKETVAAGATLTNIIGAGGAITESAIANGTYYSYMRGTSNGVTGLWNKGAATFAPAFSTIVHADTTVLSNGWKVRKTGTYATVNEIASGVFNTKSLDTAQTWANQPKGVACLMRDVTAGAYTASATLALAANNLASGETAQGKNLFLVLDSAAAEVLAVVADLISYRKLWVGLTVDTGSPQTYGLYIAYYDTVAAATKYWTGSAWSTSFTLCLTAITYTPKVTVARAADGNFTVTLKNGADANVGGTPTTATSNIRQISGNDQVYWGDILEEETTGTVPGSQNIDLTVSALTFA